MTVEERLTKAEKDLEEVKAKYNQLMDCVINMAEFVKYSDDGSRNTIFELARKLRTIDDSEGRVVR